MKRIAAIVLLLVILSGCSGDTGEMERPLHFRKALLESNGCAFDAVILADYGDKYYEFELACKVNAGRELRFSVMQPDTISGISGIVSDKGAELTFDDNILAFEMLADGQLSPVIAPWIMCRGMIGGYISACGEDGKLLRVQIDDSFKQNPLKLDIWLDKADHPVRAEILWGGRRILSLTIRNFVML